MLQRSCSTLLFLVLFVFIGHSAFAQVEPDTVRRKESLPTGPPATAPPAQRQPRVQQPQPVVVKQEPADREKLTLMDRLYWGGSLGLQFGTFTNVSLLPIIGYRVTDRFSFGGGVVYNYRSGGGVSLQNYGGRAFTQVELIEIGGGAILAHGEIEALSAQYLVYNPTTRFYDKQRKMLSLPLIGVGYRQRISEKASFDLLLLYNGSSDIANPYNNPVIRGGVNIPFRR
ncbi:hypothetical protein [Pontibacter harenae]|uniref:hypothetical protein n=1 Tax=Pontibacter harenae TaxID=2894083 RepID=UPI001E59F12F|nr:hypothetical protein [Pontibacter harenae]MCC9167616.1 hypothetical protein [Pontibacter harenae]